MSPRSWYVTSLWCDLRLTSVSQTLLKIIGSDDWSDWQHYARHIRRISNARVPDISFSSISLWRESLARRRSTVLLPGVQAITLHPLDNEHQLALVADMISPSLRSLRLSAHGDLLYPDHMRHAAIFFHRTLQRSNLDLEVLDLILPVGLEALIPLTDLLAASPSLKFVRLGAEYESHAVLRALASLPELGNVALYKWCHIMDSVPLDDEGHSLARFPRLKGISAGDNSAQSILGWTSSDAICSLHIHLSDPHAPTSFESIWVVPNLSHTLTSVKIVCEHRHDAAALPSIISHLAGLHGLKKLQLEGFIPPDDYARLPVIVPSWPQLQILRWRPTSLLSRGETAYITQDVLGIISKSCPDICDIVLHIAWTSPHQAEAVTMPKLRSLSVYGWKVDKAGTDAIVQVFRQLITSSSSKVTLERLIRGTGLMGTATRSFWTVVFWRVRNQRALDAGAATADEGGPLEPSGGSPA